MPQDKANIPSRFSRTRSIILVMLGTLSSRLLGFMRNAVIAFYFGAGEKADVLNFIQAVPTLLRRLAAEGSLETALVPELSRSCQRDQSLRESNAIWRKLLAIQWSIIFPLCLLLALFPQQIINFLTEFPKEEQVQLASRMLYLVSPYILLLSQSVLLGALLSSQHKFTLSAFTPLLTSVAVIGATVLLQALYGVFAVLFGMLVGIILQLILLLPAILRAGYSLLPDFRLRDPAIRRIGTLWLPLWLSTSLLALMQFVANYLASQAQSGSVSALTNALIFFQLPQGLIYASIAKVCLPQMSRDSTQAETQANAEVSQVLRYGLGQLCILLLPATLILFVMSRQLIAVSFQRGAFALQDTLLTAQVLRYYALGSLPVAIFRFLQQYLYARSQKFQPLVQTLIVALIDIPLSFFLVFYLGWGVIALPVANTISYVVTSLYAYFITGRYSVGLLDWSRWCRWLGHWLPKLLLLLLGLCLVDAALLFVEQNLLAPQPVSQPKWQLGWQGLRYLNNLQLSAESLQSSQNWWWSSGGSIANFSIAAVHGLLLLAFLVLFSRLLGLPLLRNRQGQR